MEYDYYMLSRPPMPGAMPREGLIAIEDFGDKQVVPELKRAAWGKLTYDRMLTEDELERYELADPMDYVISESFAITISGERYYGQFVGKWFSLYDADGDLIDDFESVDTAIQLLKTARR